MLNYLAETNTSITNQVSAVADITNNAYAAFRGIVNVIFPIVIGVVLVLGLFFGIQLAIKYARAEEEDQKKKAKGSLINVIVGCLIAIVFVVIIMLVLRGDYIKNLFGEGVPEGTNLTTSTSTPAA